MNQTLSHIIMILEAPLKEMGYDLVEANFSLVEGNNTLSIVVDRIEPISLNEIVKVSERIGEILDEDDCVEGAYTLDVSSLGAEKPIKIENLPSYVSRYVNLHLAKPYKGENSLEGTLVEVSEAEIKIEIRQKEKKVIVSAPKEDVDKARLAIKF